MKKNILKTLVATSALFLSYDRINAQEQYNQEEQGWRAFDSFLEEADENNTELDNLELNNNGDSGNNGENSNNENNRRRRINHSPVAIINYEIGDEFLESGEDDNAFENRIFLPLSVDGSESYDQDGDNLEYVWEVNYNGEICTFEGISFNINIPLNEGENELRLILTVKDRLHRGEQLEDIDELVFSYFLEREVRTEYIMLNILNVEQLSEYEEAELEGVSNQRFNEELTENERTGLYITGNFGYSVDSYLFEELYDEEIKIKMLNFNLGALIDMYFGIPIFFDAEYSTTIFSEEDDFEVRNSNLLNFAFGSGYADENILLTAGLLLNNYNFNFSNNFPNNASNNSIVNESTYESINETDIGAEANFIADLERVLINLTGSLHENGYNYNGSLGVRLTSLESLGLIMMFGFDSVNNDIQNYHSIPLNLCLMGGRILSTNASLCFGASIKLNNNELLFNNFNIGFGSYNEL